MSNSEQALQQEAIRRRLAGESRKAICVALNRATSWFDKYQIENFHSLWVQAFWSRHEFANFAEVKSEEPKFLRWYLRCYDPPALKGRTPAQVRRGVLLRPFDKAHQSLIPSGRLPITKGFVHFMRKVDSSASIDVLNERWPVHKRLIGCYMRATIDLYKRQLTIWHKSD